MGFEEVYDGLRRCGCRFLLVGVTAASAHQEEEEGMKHPCDGCEHNAHVYTHSLAGLITNAAAVCRLHPLVVPRPTRQCDRHEKRDGYRGTFRYVVDENIEVITTMLQSDRKLGCYTSENGAKPKVVHVEHYHWEEA